MTRRTLALIALPLFCLLGAALLALFLALRPPPPEMPALLRDLPADETAGSAEFQRRLRERFPDHSLADDLVAELNAQGFDTWPEAGLAHFVRHARPCTEFLAGVVERGKRPLDHAGGPSRASLPIAALAAPRPRAYIPTCSGQPGLWT